MLDRTGVGAPQLSGAGVDLSAGKLTQTGNPLDLAISGEGYFEVHGPAQALMYTRQGQFHRDDQGRLVTGAGLVLQADGGGDLDVGEGAIKVEVDGSVTLDGEPVGRVAIANLSDAAAADWIGGGFTAPAAAMTPAERPELRQGFLEASNVSTGDEMVSIMAAMRRAESGQHLMLTYDDLMGRVLTAFGQA